LNFSARVASATAKAKCVCGAEAGQDLPRSFSVSTNVPTQGLSAPDTGLSSHDYVYDRVVGEDSRTKWAQIAARQKDKVRVIEAEGVTGFDLSRKPDGTYGVMTPQQRAASERSRKFHFKMDAHGKALKAQKAT
jgi:hypothetical protein